MTVGKPDFNLNSFGVKYLSKDEIQEFLEKYEIPTGKDQAALATERDKKGTGFKSSESANKLVSDVTPKVAEKPAVITDQTTSIFNDDKYGVPRRGGSLTKPVHSAGRGALGYVGEKQPTKTNPERSGAGNAPSTLPKENKVDMKVARRKVVAGKGKKGKEAFDKTEGKGEPWYAADEDEPHSIQGVKRQGKKDAKNKKIGALQGIINDKKHADQIKLLQSQKPEDRKTYDTIQDDKTIGTNYETTRTDTGGQDLESDKNTESEESFKKRSRENERKRQADAAKKKKKLTDKERMTNIVEGYRAERGLGKSNDIILDMNILKLDLMKGVKSQKYVKPNMQSAGKNPAKRLSNAGGIQNKLETLQNEAPKLTPKDIERQDKNEETGVTGKPKGSVANQYT